MSPLVDLTEAEYAAIPKIRMSDIPEDGIIPASLCDANGEVIVIDLAEGTAILTVEQVEERTKAKGAAVIPAQEVQQVKANNTLPKRAKDLTGVIFPPYKVLSYAGSTKFGKSMWYCVCEVALGGCGKQVVIEAHSLHLRAKKQTVRCTCLLIEGNKGKVAEGYKGRLTGQLIGKLRVGERTAKGYRCTCTECGSESLRSYRNLDTQVNRHDKEIGKWCKQCLKEKFNASTGTVIQITPEFLKEYGPTIWAGLNSVLGHECADRKDLFQLTLIRLNGKKVTERHGGRSTGAFVKKVAQGEAHRYVLNTNVLKYQKPIVVAAAPELQDAEYKRHLDNIQDESLTTGEDADSRLGVMAKVWGEWSDEDEESAAWLKQFHESGSAEKSSEDDVKADILQAMLRSRFAEALRAADLRRTDEHVS